MSKFMEKWKKSFLSRQFQSGAYSTFVTVLVIVIVVVINMMFSKLDLSLDLSKGGLFTLSKESMNLIKDNTTDVTLYYMVANGDEEERIQNVLTQYRKASKHIRLKKIDPVVNPGFASKHNITEEVASNDVIVVNEKSGTSQYVSSEDMYYAETDYSTYQQNQYLDVEGQITSAIQNVLAESTTKMYIVSGHEEADLSETLIKALGKMNIETEGLELLTAKEIPSDCDILLMNGPTTDITEKERDLVLSYLKEGGDAIINAQYTTNSQKNLFEILKYYGIMANQGVVCEGANHYYYYPNYIVPTVGTSELTTDFSGYFIIPNSIGLTPITNVRSSLKVEQLITTSEDSYLKLDPSSGSAEKENGDINGPFAPGICVTEQTGSEETRLIVFSSADVFLEEYVSMNQLENAKLFHMAAGYMEKSEITKVAIEPKSLDYSYISMPVSGQLLWAAVLILLIPGGILIFGFVVWMIRRRR